MATKTNISATQSKHAHYSEALQKAIEQKRVNTSNRIIRLVELKKRVGLSRSSIYALIKSGDFPESISLGARARGWLESDAEAFIESRLNTSRKAT